jgi:ornithine carbamoyltransferase
MNAHSFLEVDDLDPAQLREVLDRAQRWKADPSAVPDVLGGRGVALLFEKPSARTRVSTEMGVSTLGGHAIYLRGEEVGIGTRESPEDVARTLECFCAVIAARVFEHGLLETMRSAVAIPVVNLLSDRAHPCQALADSCSLATATTSRHRWHSRPRCVASSSS